MTGTKTNERPGTRAQARNVAMSATKARVVLDLVRNKSVEEAVGVLAYTERRAAEVIGKCIDSAVANAEHNDQIDPETLFVSACYADEGRTLYRWRPRARGRATRIRKRTCHITVIVSPMPADMLAKAEAKREAIPGSRAARRRGQESAERSERVAKSQAADAAEDEEIVDTDAAATAVAEDAEVSPSGVDETAATEAIEEQGIVDTNVEATTTDGDTDQTDAEAADDADAVDVTAPIAEDVDETDAADDTTEEK